MQDCRENISKFSLLSITTLSLKRLFDTIFSSIVLIFLSPLFLIIALIIRSSSKGNVIYSHERVGKNGVPFLCYKFRTMYPDADERLQEILEADPLKQAEWNTSHKLRNDPRVIPVGTFLRKTSLDELPQFWNVLKGDLSVVGPRPVTKEEVVKHFGPRAHKIFSVRPGITGLWQVSGRSNTTYSERSAFEERYVDNRSWFLDLKIVALTIPSMIFRKGAY